MSPLHMSSASKKTGAAQFHSADNKAMLWTALQEAGAFSGLKAGMDRQVMASIESRMIEVAAAPQAFRSDVTGLNKRVLQAVMSDIGGLKRRPETAGIQHAFAQKESDIRQMVEGKRPRNVDFSDPTDKPMGGSMDRAVQEALARRTNQMESSVIQYASTMKDAEGWIGRKLEQPSQVRQLKIGETLGPEAAEAESLPQEKRVRFEPLPAAPSSGVAASNFLNSIKRADASPPADVAPAPADPKLIEALSRLEAIVEPVPGLLREVLDALPRLRSSPSPDAAEPPSPEPVSPAGIEPIGGPWKPVDC